MGTLRFFVPAISIFRALSERSRYTAYSLLAGGGAGIDCVLDGVPLVRAVGKHRGKHPTALPFIRGVCFSVLMQNPPVCAPQK